MSDQQRAANNANWVCVIQATGSTSGKVRNGAHWITPAISLPMHSSS